MTHSHVQHSLNMCVPFRALQPQIFSTLGLTQSGALLGTLTVSAVNIAATIIAILAVDRCARRSLWSSTIPSAATVLLLFDQQPQVISLPSQVVLHSAGQLLGFVSAQFALMRESDGRRVLHMLGYSCIWTVRRAGRRSLYLAGGVQMFTAQIATAILMGVAFRGATPSIGAIIALEVLVCIFTIGFAYSHGPLDWLVSCLPASTLAHSALWLSLLVHRTVDHGVQLKFRGIIT